MRMKKISALCLSCVMIISALAIRVAAADQGQSIMYMETMSCQQVDLQNAGILDDISKLRGTDSLRGAVSANSISIGSPFNVVSGGTITINCSYSPLSSSMDFGVIAPDGKFYFSEAKGGSITWSIRVNQTGSYRVAVRNNSSQTVSVVGFVNY